MSIVDLGAGVTLAASLCRQAVPREVAVRRDHFALPGDHARPKGTDAEVNFSGAPIWTVRDGKIARIEFYWNRHEGLMAAGLVD